MSTHYKKLIEGELVNNWIVLKEFGIKNRVTRYHVRCLCGYETIKNRAQINKNKMCFACSRKKQTENGGTRRTHGACSSSSDLFKTYMAWHYMKRRCEGKTLKEKRNYADRGIKVCEKWLNSFQSFLLDMGKRPDNSSLDRINNDKGYEPSNCKWASIQEQNDNKRGCIYYSYEGETLTIARWAERWGITRSKAFEWLKREGIAWVIGNLERIKACKVGMSNKEYMKLGFDHRKGSGQRTHAASRDTKHPLHKMYKSWDYMKHKIPGPCNGWKDFMKFVEDMGQKPEGLRLLRKFTNEPFSKDNCYWG